MWTWKQSTGELFDATPDAPAVSRGYAGLGAGQNNPAAQDQVGVGPLPRGTYAIQSPRDTDTHGPYVLPLAPDLGNEMFGRSGFLIHGDGIRHPGTASHGCVILPRLVRQMIWESGDHVLRVVE